MNYAPAMAATARQKGAPMERVRTMLTTATLNVSIAPEEPLIVEAQLDWEFASDRWCAGSTVSQWYSKLDMYGSRVEAVATIRFVNKKRETVERQDPERMLAFRGLTRLKIEDFPTGLGLVIVTLIYHLHFRNIECLREDVELDRKAIATWLESNLALQEALEAPAEEADAAS